MDEISRILKPNGKLIIIDTFISKNIINNFTTNVDNYWYNRDYSKKQLLSYYVPIEKFIKIYLSKKFKNIKVNNLTISGKVKKIHLYCFLFYRVIPSLLSNINKKTKISKVYYPFKFISLMIYKFIIILYSKPYYYSIISLNK